MDFILSEEQAILRSMAARFAAEMRPGTDKTALEPSQRWRRYADIGVLGLALAEEYGGMGGGGVETMIVAEEMGRALLTDPFVSVAAVAAPLIEALGDEAQKRSLLPGMASGELLVVPALLEPGARYSLDRVATSAQFQDNGWRLDGHKAVVLGAPQAHYLLVSARIAGAINDPDGIAVFLIPTGHKGVELRPIRTLDERDAAEIRLEQVTLGSDALLGGRGQALAAIKAAVERGAAAVAGEAVGAMAGLFDMCVEYLQTRKQFGVPIGTFQVLQHRLVDMKVALEMARSITAAAAMSVDGDDVPARRRMVAAAKIHTGRAGRLIGQHAIQLHGAMGMTEEYGAGRYLKRLMVLSALFGDGTHHLDGFIAATG